MRHEETRWCWWPGGVPGSAPVVDSGFPGPRNPFPTEKPRPRYDPDRALDFLTSHGFAHKIERLNAFIACAHMGDNHAPAFLICRACSAVAETYADPMQGDLGRAARAAGFHIERAVIEAEGLCPGCQETSPA